MFNEGGLTEGNKAFLALIFLQTDPHLVFDHCVQFNNLHLEPYWAPNISGTEPYRALKWRYQKESLLRTNG